MRDEPLPVDPERLLAEDPFVRGLARQLLRDPDRADDLAQRTWLLLLRERVATVSLRGFLATVMRRLAQRERRGSQREAARVAALPRPEVVPSAATIAAREELRARVVKAVLALPEPYREVVLLRFFEHLPPRAIARRLQLPVETVRTRQKRALAQLRNDLDAEARGDRAAWAVLLVPFERPAAAGFTGGVVAAIQGAMAMATKLQVAAALAACAVLVWLGTGALRGGSDADLAPREVASNSSRASLPDATTGDASSSHAEAAAAPQRSDVAAAGEPTTGSLRVHVAWEEDQLPAAGVLVGLERTAGDDDGTAPVRATTDERGTVTFDDVPVGRAAVELVQRKVRPEWPRVAIAAGARAELSLQVQRGLTASGIVVDGAGRPIDGAEVMVCDWGGGEAVTMARSGADGRFRARAIETSCHIGARAAGFAASPMVQCTTKPGADLELRLVLDAPAATLCGTVYGPDGRPVAGAKVQAGSPEQNNVHRPDGTMVMAPRPEVVRTDAQGHYALRAQPAGTVPFRVRSKGLAAHQESLELRADVATVHDVHLLAGVTLAGSIRDSNGQPLAEVGVAVGEWNALDHRWVRSDRDGAFTVRDLPVGPLPVAIEGEARGRASKVLQGAAGETLRWDVVLDAGITLRGRVLLVDGAPARDVRIEAESARVRGGSWRGSAQSGADGRFELPGCSSDLRISLSLRRSGVFADLRVHGVRPGPDELVLRLPRAPSAHIVGRVELPDGGVPQNVAVSPSLDGEGGSPVESVDAATGAFRIGPYPAGDYQLSVHAPGFAEIRLRGRIGDGDTVWDVGLLRLEPGGTLKVDLIADRATQLPNHWLSVFDATGLGVAQLEEEGGASRAGPLQPGDYVLQVGGDGLCNTQVPFSIRAGVETHLQVPVHTGVRSLLTVELPEGEDVHARIEATIADRAGATVFRGTLWCNGSVATTATMLAPGTYTVTAWRGGRRAAGEWTVPAAGAPELKLRLQ